MRVRCEWVCADAWVLFFEVCVFVCMILVLGTKRGPSLYID